jgi:hypothetical protein
VPCVFISPFTRRYQGSDPCSPCHRISYWGPFVASCLAFGMQLSGSMRACFGAEHRLFRPSYSQRNQKRNTLVSAVFLFAISRSRGGFFLKSFPSFAIGLRFYKASEFLLWLRELHFVLFQTAPAYNSFFQILSCCVYIAAVIIAAVSAHRYVVQCSLLHPNQPHVALFCLREMPGIKCDWRISMS